MRHSDVRQLVKYLLKRKCRYMRVQISGGLLCNMSAITVLFTSPLPQRRMQLLHWLTEVLKACLELYKLLEVILASDVLRQ